MRPYQVLRVLMALTLMALASLGSAIGDESTPDARALMDKGQLAMEQREWHTAIRHLLQALEKTPDNPDLLYSLGVAESNVPGRELRAMAWLHAYLLTVPSAPDAEAVRKEIEKLDVRVKELMNRLKGQVWSIQGKLDHMQGMPLQNEIVQTQAMVGDIEGALKHSMLFPEEYLRALAADDRPPVAPAERLPELLRLIRDDMGGDWFTNPSGALQALADSSPSDASRAGSPSVAYHIASRTLDAYKAIGLRRKDLLRLVR